MNPITPSIIQDLSETESRPCVGCKNSIGLDFDFEYAFQPIVYIRTKTIFAHEALIRGPNGEGAATILSKVNNDNIYRFDQACRVKAVKTAAELQIKGFLFVNFMPNAVYRLELCISTTLAAAKKYNFSASNIILNLSSKKSLMIHGIF